MGSANMKDIKRRIKSVESTMQITKAMELVASSKLRKAKEKADKAKPYFETTYEVMSEICNETSAFDSIYTRKQAQSNSLLIVIAGDRGLAGGFNANVLKLAEQRADELSKDGSVKFLAIGRKAVEYYEKRECELLDKFSAISETITFYSALRISDIIVDEFTTGKINQVELIYTNYVSPLLQEATVINVLPLDKITNNDGVKSDTTYEPSAEKVFDSLIPQYLAGIIFGAVVESFASEQASRRIAMENATDNAGDMISSLSLIYNRARQAAITQEITEIIGGASAHS